jgi:hypothetical protein
MSEPNQAYQLKPRWRRLRALHSYDPASGITHVRPWWHPVHIRAAVNRVRWRYMAWQQRHS